MSQLTDDEAAQLVGMFRTLGVKPKSDSPEDLKKWMQEYLDSQSVSDTSQPSTSSSTSNSVPNMVVSQNPRVSSFSGVVKGDQVSYEVWKYEVRSLIQGSSHSKEAILVAVRKSLKGEAANVAMTLGVSANLEELIAKFEGLYGTVEASESLYAQFYGETQRDDEDVTKWALRLEDLLDRVKHQSNLNPSGADEMLRTKFWAGLKPELNDASAHKFDTVKKFDELVVALRRIELEHLQRTDRPGATAKVKTQSRSATVKASKSPDVTELTETINSLTAAVKSMQEQFATNKAAPPQQESKRKPFKPRNQQQSGQTPAQEQRPQASPNTQEPQGASGQQSSRGPIVCWRCGGEGHVRIGCRAQINSSSSTNSGHLNESRPAAQGR